MPDRRDLLKGMAVAALVLRDSSRAAEPASSASPARGEPRPFDFAALKGMARGLAEVPYRGAENKLPDTLAAVDYDEHQAIRYRPERALWVDDALSFRV